MHEKKKRSSSKSKKLPNRPFNVAEMRIAQGDLDNKEKLKKMFTHKSLQFSKPASVDLKNGIIDGVASKQVADREGDVVELNNILVQSNVPLLYIHDQYDPKNVIGRVEEIKVVGDELHFKAQLDTGDQYAMDILRKVDGGFITGVSIGFKPQSWDDVELIEDERGYIKERRIKAIELLEISLCAVAMNPHGAVKSADTAEAGEDITVVFTAIQKSIEEMTEIPRHELKSHIALHKAYGELIKMSHPKYKQKSESVREFLSEMELQKEVAAYLNRES